MRTSNRDTTHARCACVDSLVRVAPLVAPILLAASRSCGASGTVSQASVALSASLVPRLLEGAACSSRCFASWSAPHLVICGRI
eukprot:649808-Pleurochrysis_carterae.AAC.3